MSYARHIQCILSHLQKMVRLAGLEPTTHSLEGCCSIQMSYRRIFHYQLLSIYSLISYIFNFVSLITSHVTFSAYYLKYDFMNNETPILPANTMFQFYICDTIYPLLFLIFVLYLPFSIYIF